MARKDRVVPDPEELRWRRKYGRLPGVAECLRLLRNGNVHGTRLELVCQALTEHAAACANELIAAYREEAYEPVRHLILMAVADARHPAFQDLLVEALSSGDERLVDCAKSGLRELNTKEARAALCRLQGS